MYCIGVQNRGRPAWDFLWKVYKMEGVKRNDKNALLEGMGCARVSWLLLRYVLVLVLEDPRTSSFLDTCREL